MPKTTLSKGKNNTQKKTNQLWAQYDFLIHTSFTQKNIKLLNAFFVQKFSHSPEDFSKFIKFFKKEMTLSPERKKKDIARRYLEVLSSLCERFWLYNEKLELDDMCFIILYPEEYKKLDIALAKYKKESQKIIRNIFTLFEKLIKKHEIQGIIKWRYKNLYSIFKKCQKWKIQDIFTLHDIFAFRIITKEQSAEECFKIINILHDAFIPIPMRFKDYISIPKVNGYQSIHTSLAGLIDDSTLKVEVQVRTQHMDDVCEKWIASHYSYKAFGNNTLPQDKEWKLRSHMTKIVENFWQSNTIHCLTPKWDIIELNRWASLKDFARKIHTDLAKKAKYGIVNGSEQSLSYIPSDMQTVEIIT